MNQPIQEIIGQRYSCRSYLDEPIQEIHQQVLKRFLETQQIGPLGTHARFELVAATQDDRQSLKGLGTYGYIKNPTGFIIGALEQGPKNLEDYGYLLEHAILAATDIGLGTCWLGGTFTKSSFAKKITLRNEETIPAVIATGYIAEKKGNNGKIRRYLSANRRLPMEQLFFADTFGNPLTIEATGAYAHMLEMVRWAPSASNKQPWRIIRIDDAWHFYLQRTKGYGKGTLLFNILRLADLQRVDMGIAMCHFELTARALGLNGHWANKDPQIKTPENTEYTVSWIDK
ncbi:MAG: nitroreductase family protein [Bacteroidota bacterium]|jgi:nitroreductase